MGLMEMDETYGEMLLDKIAELSADVEFQKNIVRRLANENEKLKARITDYENKSCVELAKNKMIGEFENEG